MPKGIRKNITIPGLLAPSLRQRVEEFGFQTLSPYVFDLVSFDLQSCAPHTITIAIAADSQSAQDAVDAELARRYRPGEPRNGLLVHVIERLNELRTTARKLPPAPALTAKPERVMFPARIWKDVDRRWQELGYPSLSAYVTGLARYDLLLGGPHRTVSETVNRAKQDAHARKSIVRYRRGEPRKLYIDHLIERTEGRTLSKSELEQSKGRIAQQLRGLFTEL